MDGGVRPWVCATQVLPATIGKPCNEATFISASLTSQADMSGSLIYTGIVLGTYQPGTDAPPIIPGSHFYSYN